MTTTSSPRSRSRSASVDPMNPAPPVMKTLIPSTSCHPLKLRSVDHCAIPCRLIVEELIPQFQAQKPPELAAETLGVVDGREDRFPVNMGAALSSTRAKDIVEHVAELSAEPFLERHGKPHLVPAIANGGWKIVGEGDLDQMLHPAVLELHVSRDRRDEFNERVIE